VKPSCRTEGASANLERQDSQCILWQAFSWVTEMTYAQHARLYRCDRCGSPDLVALSLLYERGTRTQSGPAYWGKSQSYSAQNATPPRQKSYGGPVIVWGFVLAFILFWCWAFSQALSGFPRAAGNVLVFLALLGLACLAGFAVNCRWISHYNRAVFPTLHWTWLHTYRCQRCGKLVNIPS
jgi:DNA-directed RNA polymerase subunit RPC12/RpoP